MEQGAYPIPVFPPFQTPTAVDATLLQHGGIGVDVPSIEPFIAANLILAPNPWCLQPPAAFYKYTPRIDLVTGATSLQTQDAIEDDVDTESPDEGGQGADGGDTFFGAKYLNIPITAVSAHFPTNEIVGEKRKRDDEEEHEEEATLSAKTPDELEKLIEPQGAEITWQEGIAKRNRGRESTSRIIQGAHRSRTGPKGSKDSKPRDLTRTHRYRSLQSGIFVPRDHADAVLDSLTEEDHDLITDESVLRRKILGLAGRFYADLAKLMERSTAETAASCLDSDVEIKEIVRSVETISSKMTRRDSDKSESEVSPLSEATPLGDEDSAGESQSRPTTASTSTSSPLTDSSPLTTPPSAPPVQTHVLSEIVLIPSVIEALVKPVRAV